MWQEKMINTHSCFMINNSQPLPSIRRRTGLNVARLVSVCSPCFDVSFSSLSLCMALCRSASHQKGPWGIFLLDSKISSGITKSITFVIYGWVVDRDQSPSCAGICYASASSYLCRTMPARRSFFVETHLIFCSGIRIFGSLSRKLLGFGWISTILALEVCWIVKPAWILSFSVPGFASYALIYEAPTRLLVIGLQ
jgi:hypothetical protein